MSVSIALATDYIRGIKATNGAFHKFLLDHHTDVLASLVLYVYRALANVYERHNHKPMPEADFTRLMELNLNIIVGSVHWSLKEQGLPESRFMSFLRSLPFETVESCIFVDDVDLSVHPYSWNNVFSSTSVLNGCSDK